MEGSSDSMGSVQRRPKRTPRGPSATINGDTDLKVNVRRSVLLQLRSEEEQVQGTRCFLCWEPASSCCNWCRGAHFCSQEHYQVHRNGSRCWPFRVEALPGRGRCLMASRRIRAGEPVLTDEAVMVAPGPNSTPTCPSCLRKLPNDPRAAARCPKCRIPVCGKPDCPSRAAAAESSAADLHRLECGVFAANGVRTDFEHFENPQPLYSCIGPLRMLSLEARAGPQQPDVRDAWRRLSALPDHTGERRRNRQGEWNMVQLDVVDFLRDRCFLKNVLSGEDLHRAFGRFAVNGTSLEGAASRSSSSSAAMSGKALFPLFSVLNHDCLGNTRVRLQVQPGLLRLPRVEVTARRDIEVGEEVTVQYLTTMMGTHKRRKRLAAEWYFDCRCCRCSDPTECGTFVSALICEACGGTTSAGSPTSTSSWSSSSIMLPDDPLDHYSGWTCNSCDFTLSVQDVERKVDQIEEELSQVTLRGDPGALEEFVRHYSRSVLHPNHYLLLLARRNHYCLVKKAAIRRMAAAMEDAEPTRAPAQANGPLLSRDHLEILDRLHCTSK